MNNGLLGIPATPRSGIYYTPPIGMEKFTTAGQKTPLQHPYDRTPSLVRTLYRCKKAETIYVPGQILQDCGAKYAGGRSFEFVMNPHIVVAILSNGDGATNFQFRSSLANSNLMAAATPANWEILWMIVA